jgi:hypothetical protein
MFYVNLNGINLMIYTLETVQKYMQVSGDPRYTKDDLFLDLGDGLYTRRTLTRGDLYKAMGYQTFDFAYPEPWADSPQALDLFKTYGDLIPYEDPETGQRKVRSWQPGDPRPRLVWCYDADKEGDRPSIFGYPVFDKQVIRDLGQAVRAKAMIGEVDHIDTSWLDKKENDADLLIGEINGV